MPYYRPKRSLSLAQAEALTLDLAFLTFGYCPALLTKAVTGKGLNTFKPWLSKRVERAQPFPACGRGGRDVRLVWDLSSLSARFAQLLTLLESDFFFYSEYLF